MTQRLLRHRRIIDGKTSRGPSEALGQSEVFLEFQEALSRVASVNRPVLIQGERGSGKELAAARLHFLSQRWQGPYITLNCSALSPTLIESELFGHEKGAFTGAVERRVGRFEAADGGTLFLDEIGTVPRQVQEKILRVVEYNAFERVGGLQTVETDVRILAATNVNLQRKAARNQFKQDLLDRLSFEVLTIPPLRARQEDIDLLAHHFAGRMALELGWGQTPEFGEAAMDALRQYHWPGNVRELKNVVERAVYRSPSHLIRSIDMDPFRSPFETRLDDGETPSEAPVEETAGESLRRLPLKTAVWRLKKEMVTDALRRAEHNQTKAAGLLGLTYHQFRGLYRQYQKDKSQ